MATFEQLKAKYQSVIDLAKARGVSLKNVHLENDKLADQGRRAEPGHQERGLGSRSRRSTPSTPTSTADIGIDASLPVPAKIYEVVGGDTLSKIAKKFYGDANKYMKIFEANKDQLKDPDKIKVGQKLKIPE